MNKPGLFLPIILNVDATFIIYFDGGLWVVELGRELGRVIGLGLAEYSCSRSTAV